MDLDSKIILNVDLVYEQNLPVLYFCLLCSMVFAFLFLQFTIAFFFAFNQNNSYNRQTANTKKLTKAEDWNSKSTNHRTYSDLSLTIVFSKRSGLLHLLLAAKWCARNSLFGLNFRTHPNLTVRKNDEKTKFWGQLVESAVFQITVIKSTFDHWIEAELT